MFGAIGGLRFRIGCSAVALLGIALSGCSVGVRNGTLFEVVAGVPSEAAPTAAGASYRRGPDGRTSIQAFELMATTRVDQLRCEDIAFHLPSAYTQSPVLGVICDIFMDLISPGYLYPTVFEVIPVGAEDDRAPAIYPFTVRWHIVGWLVAILPGITVLPGTEAPDPAALPKELIYERAPPKELAYSNVMETSRKPVEWGAELSDLESWRHSLNATQWRSLLDRGSCLVALRKGPRLSGLVEVRLEDALGGHGEAVGE